MLTVSRRARRMDRHHKAHKGSPLNLVSLMDIFTILVFFLLVNSSSTQQIPRNDELRLPESVAKKAPRENLIIAVTKSDVLVQGRKVASLSDVQQTEVDVIDGLLTELEFLSGGGKDARSVTIMGDENIAYDVVHKILKTCQQANYTNVAFAATQVASKPY